MDIMEKGKALTYISRPSPTFSSRINPFPLFGQYPYLFMCLSCVSVCAMSPPPSLKYLS